MGHAAVTPKAERMSAVEVYMRSGQTIQRYSQENHINHHTLHNWIQEYKREQGTDKKPKNSWIELKVSANENETRECHKNRTQAQPTPIRVTFGKAVIEVTSGFDETTLSTIIKVVSAQC